MFFGGLIIKMAVLVIGLLLIMWCCLSIFNYVDARLFLWVLSICIICVSYRIFVDIKFVFCFGCCFEYILLAICIVCSGRSVYYGMWYCTCFPGVISSLLLCCSSESRSMKG